MKNECYSLSKEIYEKNAAFYDSEIIEYKSQLEFFVNVSKLFIKVRERNIPVVYPIIDSSKKEIFIADAYDISLIAKNQSFIIPNDIDFSDKYTFTFLTGANGGDLMGIIVNLSDYNVGADNGGAVNLFVDFDIDYNAQKYLIETRCSGALTKPFSAMTVFSAELEAEQGGEG